MPPRDHAHQPVLRRVGVLVLIDQHVPVTFAVTLKHPGEELEKVQHVEEEIVEIQSVVLPEPLLVQAVDPAGQLIGEILRL